MRKFFYGPDGLQVMALVSFFMSIIAPTVLDSIRELLVAIYLVISSHILFRQEKNGPNL